VHEVPRETALVELPALSARLGCTILAKCEHLQPGGSVKDRAAHALVSAGELSGKVRYGEPFID